MQSEQIETTWELPIETSEGVFLARYSKAGLCRLEFPSKAGAKPRAAGPTPPLHIQCWHELTVRALTRALAGQPAAELPPLDFSAGSQFQRQVWQVLTGIGAGQTRSYAEVARAIGNPKALRAVGGACGANPIPVLVPCHRVLAAHQRLGGFSGGLGWKRTLLAREGIRISE